MHQIFLRHKIDFHLNDIVEILLLYCKLFHFLVHLVKAAIGVESANGAVQIGGQLI